MVCWSSGFQIGKFLMYQIEIHFSKFIYSIKIKICKILCRNLVVSISLFFSKFTIFYFMKSKAVQTLSLDCNARFSNKYIQWKKNRKK